MDIEILQLSTTALYTIGLVVKKLKRRQKRKLWTKAWHSRRCEGRGVLNMLNEELLREDPASYRNFLRLTSQQFDNLLKKLEPYISRTDSVMRQCVSARNRLEVTLRFLATGDSYRSLMFATRIHESTISVFVPEVLKWIFVVLKEDHVKTPTTSEDWKVIAETFEKYWNFPQCLGSLDGRHIKFRPPRSAGSYYYNYKGEHSLILLAMSDALYRFTYINVGVNGRVSDGGVFRESSLAKVLQTNSLSFPAAQPLPGRLQNVPFVIVADDAFPLTRSIMKPYPQRNLSHDQKVFNYRLSRARRVVENAFGILANRFRVLLNPINLAPNKVELITMAAVALHNLLATENGKVYTDIDFSQVNDLAHVQIIHPNRSTNSAQHIRNEYRSYFCSPLGSVSWQEEAILNHNM